MKRIILFSAMLMMANAGFSQNTKALKPAENLKTENVKKEISQDKQDKYKDLNLSAEQKSKIGDLKKKFKEDKNKLEADASLTADQKAAKLKELKKQHAKDFKATLTPEQMEKYRAARENSKDKDND